MKKPVLLLGGSFNPIHLSHIQILEKAYASLNASGAQVDEAWLLPAMQNPDKPSCGMASFSHRLNMCELQCRNQPWLKVCNFESTLQPPYHSFAVLSQLVKAYPSHQFIWMMGSDNLMSFNAWDYWEDILFMLPIVVMGRDCNATHMKKSQTLKMYPQALQHLSSSWDHSPNIRLIENDQSMGSATQVRHAIQQGQTPDLLSQPVLNYIQQNQLYR